MKLILSFYLIVCVQLAVLAQCTEGLKPYAVGFDSLQSGSFTFLDEVLTDVRILGFGEDTHGTADFTQLAEELTKHLSQRHGFTVLIIETGFGEGQYLNDFIQDKRTDLSGILNEHNSTWRYKTKEFHHFMAWLKDYNQKNADKIQLFGCEMQYVLSDVNRIREYLTEVESAYEIEGFDKHLWQDIDENEKTAYFNTYAKLKQYVADNSESFMAKTSKEAYSLAYHHVEVLGQFVSAINQNVEQRKHDLRDLYMSENIQWILDFQGTESKALYWAHNAHIGDWVSNGIVDVAGHHLRKIYGNAYFNIATDFGTGEFLAFSPAWKIESFQYDHVLENSFSACLKNWGEPNTFLNLRKARENKSLAEFLNQELTTMSGAGAQVRDSQTETNDCGKAFDGIIYLHETKKITWAE